MLAAQSIGDRDSKGILMCIHNIAWRLLWMHIYIGAAIALQKLNNLSKKFSVKQVTALKEMSSCLPEKNFKKSTSKLIDRCKQVKCILQCAQINCNYFILFIRSMK